MITQARLKELLRYEPETGEFFWRVARNNFTKIGSRAGNADSKQYWRTRMDGKAYLNHRLAWLYVHGRFPDKHLDHIDRDPANNCITNLREATRSQNKVNSIAYKNNCSGFKGVYPSKQRWQAQIRYNKKLIHIGSFDTVEKAHTAYCKAAKELHGEFFNGS